MRGRRWVVIASVLLATPAVAAETAAERESDPAVFALVMGVNRGIDRDLPPLQYADDDAARYLELFRSLGARVILLSRPDENTQRVSPQAAAEAAPPTRAELMRATSTLATEIATARARHIKTTLYVVYAGHGNVAEEGGAAYLTLEDTRLGAAELARDVLDRIGASESHVIVDACYSYFLAFGRGPGGKRREVRGFAGMEGLASRPDVGLLLSTSSARESHEWQAIQAGVFSHEVRSGLYGAADADGDGRVTYREIAAFISRANAAIPNERFRPDVFARAPASGPRLVDLTPGMRRHLDVGGGTEAAHYLLEDTRGVRLADFHNAPGRVIRLMRPAGVGLLYLRRHDTDEEFAIPAAPDVVALADLPAQPARTSERGAAHHAFSLLFSLPFDQTIVDGYRAPVLLEPADEDPGEPWRSAAGRNLALGVGGVTTAVAIGVGLYFLVQAHSYSAQAEAAWSQKEAAALNAQVDAQNHRAALSFGLAGAAAVATAALWRWGPWSAAPTLQAQAHGVTWGLTGRF